MTNRTHERTSTRIGQFSTLVVLCLDNRTFRADNGFAAEAARLAERLAGEHLRARDVARLHHASLAGLVAGQTAERAHALLDAAEETLIAVLGCMADAYRAARVPHARPAPRTSAVPEVEKQPDPEPDLVVLRLVVAGHTPRTRRLERALKELVTLRAPARTEVVVTDLEQEPDRYEELAVLATPVIIREAPGPARRLVGCADDLDVIVADLGLPMPPPVPVAGPGRLARVG